MIDLAHPAAGHRKIGTVPRVSRASRLTWLVIVIVLMSGAAASAAPASSRPVSVASVTRAPVHALKVPWGRIGYRSVGRGAPLVLIMGLAGTIDVWPPSLIADLAQRHRVIVFDNEGIGLSTLRPGGLTITRMADDTATLITALGLHRPDVMGWSMGGFIAQALAVRHPDAVSRLVLSAPRAWHRQGRLALGGGHPRPQQRRSGGAGLPVSARPGDVRRRLHEGDHRLSALLPDPSAHRHAPVAGVQPMARRR